MLLHVLLGFAAIAQTPDPGAALYRNACAACHGSNAKGGEGPNLFRSRVVVSAPPRALSELIVKGIPGTDMRPFPFQREQVEQLVRYLHTLTRPGMAPPAEGDVSAGKLLFEREHCFQCHMIGGKGGVFGPDLSGLALRALPEQIRRSITEPDAEIAEGFETATVVLYGGQTIQGTLKSEDNFSIQLMKPSGELVMAMKADLQSVLHESGSLMRTPRLTQSELKDLTAYLHRQRQPSLKFTSSFQTY